MSLKAWGVVVCVGLWVCLPPAVRAQRPADSSGPGSAADGGSNQQDPKNPPAPEPPPATAPAVPASPAPPPVTSNDRLFWALPNFLTVESSANIPPMTVGDKFRTEARGMFDPAEFVWVGLLAGIDQANNGNPSYGQGMAGFGLRYGTTFGDTLIENFMVGAVLPSLLRQDPRYFQKGKGGFGHRTAYALSRIFVTRSDSGHTQFNFSEVLGSALAAGISTYSYHPSGDKNIANVGGVWGTQLASDSVALMMKEFWPDLRRMFHKKAPK